MVAAVLSVQVQDFLRRYFFSIGRPEITFASDVLRYTTQIGGLLLLSAVTAKNTLNSEMALWVAAGSVPGLGIARHAPLCAAAGIRLFNVGTEVARPMALFEMAR